MLSIIKNKVQAFWKEGNERSLQVKKNIIYTFLIRGLSVLIGFMLLPLTINYLNPTQYGIWVTIASLVAWINTFDIGLSNGLRNKLAHSLALNQQEAVHRDISTTYALLCGIATSVFIVFYSVGLFFNWNWLLRVPPSVNFDLWPVLVITLASFCIQFILQPVNSILIAMHQPFKASLILLFGQALTYILICVLALFGKGNLYLLVLAASGAPVLVLLLANIYLFATSLKSFMPRFKDVFFKNAKSLMNVSGAFFFIQIGALVLYETDNVVITRVLGPQDVTTFNIPFKYFSVISIVFYIIITPYWSAFTDAYARQDLDWIKTSIRRLRKFWLAAVGLAFLMYLCSGLVYRLWIGKDIVVPGILSLSIAVYTMLQTWMVIHAYLLNGVGKLRVQLILVITTGIINIPLSVFLIKQVGLPGTVLANIIVMLITNIFITWQCRLIMANKATGIWNK
ncbi:oligosaccharide flippase family protein [Mucilaginibacter sp. ZT4R22]|uniref:Oligosaccharide flippase family protein n=1 Tax=Mucilaginibacter pankratovii TaxID=2772110 RepID=A0ABR7WRW9_9SPHI|nr:oligosaccharide flippase family protein [Mucilaginibacter pankratovii]MBD1365045.1 oligosaccharide flippase family protein [Mucilaginibacter pankratovii]